MGKSNIILIGMPSCGKSTLGVVLAKTLGLGFIDTDLIIQAQSGRKLQEIILSEGLSGFLAIEENILSGLDAHGCVIATGGSAVYSERAMRHLQKDGTVLYLAVPFDVIEKRLDNIKTRGVAMADGETLQELYDERIPLYEKYAELTLFETAGEKSYTLEENITRIVALLGKISPD